MDEKEPGIQALIGYKRNKPFSWLSKEQKESVYMAGYGGVGKTHVMLDLALEAERARGKEIPGTIVFHEEEGPFPIKAFKEAMEAAKKDYIGNPCAEIYFGTGGDCMMGDSDFEIILYNPNKLLLIC